MKERQLERNLTQEELVIVMRLYAKMQGDFFHHCCDCGVIYTKNYERPLINLQEEFGQRQIPLDPFVDYGFQISSGFCEPCYTKRDEND